MPTHSSCDTPDSRILRIWTQTHNSAAWFQCLDGAKLLRLPERDLMHKTRAQSIPGDIPKPSVLALRLFAFNMSIAATGIRGNLADCFLSREDGEFETFGMCAQRI